MFEKTAIYLFFVNHITKDIKINCYAIDKFFVEVVYDAEHNVITDVRSFKYGHSLDKYASNFKSSLLWDHVKFILSDELFL